MKKFMVISYDDDQQQTFTDFVFAENPEGAKLIIDSHRQYAVAVDAIDSKELLGLAASLKKFTRAEEKRDLHTILEAAGRACPKCGEANDDGEGDDGVCGNCADKKDSGK